jgi:hypothetical protein
MFSPGKSDAVENDFCVVSRPGLQYVRQLCGPEVSRSQVCLFTFYYFRGMSREIPYDRYRYPVKAFGACVDRSSN